MNPSWKWLAAVAALAAAAPLFAQDRTAALGKQRAAASRLEWETREAGHPTLGNIRFAVLKTPVETQAGNGKVYSRAYLSCQKTSRKLAIELTNTTAPNDPGGLRPATMPRLTCNRAEGDKLVQEGLLANWEVSDIGDALTRGFRPFPLRECVTIGIEQEVELPKGWAPKTVAIAFEIAPYGRELDSVFVSCGEVSAYEASAPSVVASSAPRAAAPPRAPPPAVATPAAPAPRPPPAPAVTPTQAGDAGWQEARTLANGKTNVRAGPSLDSAIVVALYPGDVVL
ncbi:MAG TPA: hypothetical protein VM122_01565, partial [Usitatibacter sp.]|nr:hypothetical protein [Usitatibacter sp.]